MRSRGNWSLSIWSIFFYLFCGASQHQALLPAPITNASLCSVIPMSAIPKCSPQSQLKVVSASCKWSLIVIVLSGFRPHNPVTFDHCYLHTPHNPTHPQHTHTPIRVYAVNNKSCVTSQITQTAYHLFIVVYHNNSSVRTKATASQTQAFVNELGRLPDLKINWQCCWFLSLRVCLALSCLPTRDKIETVLWKYRISLRWCCLFLFNLTILLLAVSLREDQRKIT